MITVKDFLAYVEETTRNELWIEAYSVSSNMIGVCE